MLAAVPVSSIGGVADAGGVPLAADAYAIDIDAGGRGWVRVIEAGGEPLVDVTLSAGTASDWAGLPAPLRQGAILLAAHLFVERDAVTPPPAAVTALWRPYRMMRLDVAVRP